MSAPSGGSERSWTSARRPYFKHTSLKRPKNPALFAVISQKLLISIKVNQEPEDLQPHFL
jgi:preprotein translocase subunit SecB